jgi:4-amino-4-deoxy-L-arabinose transferase-like glycosyltransferase
VEANSGVPSPWRARSWLGLIIAIYLLLAAGYALKTPKWQAPDEPAHFNYIVHLAEERSLPALKVGYYPHQYLEKAKAAKFPEYVSIEPLRYEFHQPPLYYLLGLPFYWVGGAFGLEGRILALRFLSIALGTGVLVAIYRTVREIFPQEGTLALATVGFAATVPMHLAMNAAINNDTLAELVMALILLMSVRMAMGRPTNGAVLGALLGLGLLTKTNIYLAIPLVILAALLSPERKRMLLRPLLVSLVIVLALSAWWFIRNALTYGNLDIFGWQRHDLVVVGQPRTGALNLAAARRLVVTTFHSFWAQFGWMGIPVDERIYVALLVLTMALGLGLVLYIARIVRQGALSRQQRSALGLNLVLVVLVAGSHFWYNLKFIQPQGRYLFPAIGAIGLGAVLGFRELVNRRHERLLLVLLYLGLLGLDVFCLWGVIVPYFR